MRIALYARVSTERQERQGTIGSQLDALRRFAQDQGHEIVDAYVCVDDGYSGTRLDRPGLDRLRDGAEAGAFEAVLILCPDRLARKYAYQMLILEELERFGVRAVFLEQPPSEDPHARLLVQIQGAIAEYERMKITERYRRGKLFRARQGEIIFWKVPYGYRRVPRRDGAPAHIEISEPEAQVVRQVFAWHVEAGLSVRQIALRLTESAHPTATGRTRWGPSTVGRLLRNEAYIGTMYFNRHESLDGDAKTAGRRSSARFGDIDFKAADLDGFGENWPVDYAEISPWFSKAERYMGVASTIQNRPSNPDGEYLPPIPWRCIDYIIQKGAEKIGVPYLPDRCAQLTVAHNGHPSCHYCGNCSRGCDVGSFFSPTWFTIPEAEATKNLTLLTNALVRGVVVDESGMAKGVAYVDRTTKREVEVRNSAIPNYGRSWFP